MEREKHASWHLLRGNETLAENDHSRWGGMLTQLCEFRKMVIKHVHIFNADVLKKESLGFFAESKAHGINLEVGTMRGLMELKSIYFIVPPIFQFFELGNMPEWLNTLYLGTERTILKAGLDSEDRGVQIGGRNLNN